MKSRFFISLILLLPIYHLQAQNDTLQTANTDTNSNFWFGIGLVGLAPGSYEGHMGGAITLGIPLNKALINLRVTRTSEFALFNAKPDKMLSLDILGSYMYKRKVWYVAMGSGINIMNYEYNGYGDRPGAASDSDNDIMQVGLPVNFQLYLTSRTVGIGIDAFGVISNFTTGGVMLSIIFGDLR